MITRSQFYRLALEANEGQINDGDDVLPIPTVDERVTLYLRAVHGNESLPRKSVGLLAMFYSIQWPLRLRCARLSRAPTLVVNQHLTSLPSIPRMRILAQEQSRERETIGARPLHPYEAAAQYRPSVERKEAIRVAPRRLTRTLGLTATFGLALIVTGGLIVTAVTKLIVTPL